MRFFPPKIQVKKIVKIFSIFFMGCMGLTQIKHVRGKGSHDKKTPRLMSAEGTRENKEPRFRERHDKKSTPIRERQGNSR